MTPTDFQCLQCGHRFGMADDAFTAVCPECGSAAKLDRDGPAAGAEPEPEPPSRSGCAAALGMLALLVVASLIA